MTIRLIFVYNAEAGLLSGIMDSVHKTVSPATYACGLCAITHGVFTMDRRWRTWLKTLHVPPKFYHRADFRAAWPGVEVELPAVLIERGGELAPLISADAFKAIQSVNELIAAIEGRLESLR